MLIFSAEIECCHFEVLTYGYDNCTQLDFYDRKLLLLKKQTGMIHQ